MQNIPRYPFDMPIFTMEQFHFKENSASLNYLIIGGGGGASKTGVKNKLVFYSYFIYCLLAILFSTSLFSKIDTSKWQDDKLKYISLYT